MADGEVYDIQLGLIDGQIQDYLIWEFQMMDHYNAQLIVLITGLRDTGIMAQACAENKLAILQFAIQKIQILACRVIKMAGTAGHIARQARLRQILAHSPHHNDNFKLQMIPTLPQVWNCVEPPPQCCTQYRLDARLWIELSRLPVGLLRYGKGS